MKWKRTYSCIALYNKLGQVLLQHRTDDAPTLAGQWAYFGGGIDEGESPDDACVRETKEELGYDVKSADLSFTYDFETQKSVVKKYLYVQPYDESQDLQLLEGKGMDWFRRDQIDSLNMADFNKVLAHKIFDYIEDETS